MNSEKTIHRKLFFTLLVASALSLLAIFPYLLSIQGELLKNLPISLPLVLTLSFLQSTLLFAILTYLGLKLSNKIGFKTPLLRSYFEGKPIQFQPSLNKPIAYGWLAGCLIITLDVGFSQLGVTFQESLSIPLWQGFLASFYGGIAEEIILRLFLMSLIIWGINLFVKSKEISKNSTVIWLSILITAILFGVGHLPATAALTPLTPLVIFRAILLNGIGGILFGWLYWKNGLEYAMIAHFSTDIILHVAYPAFLLA